MAHTPDSLAEVANRLHGPLRSLFGTERPVFLRSAPGRLDVLGGLSSEAGGTLAHMALPQRAAVAVQLRRDGQLVIHSDDMAPPVGESDWTVSLDSLQQDGKLASPRELASRITPPYAWVAPIVGLWYVLHQGPAAHTSVEPPGAPSGATVAIHSALPMGAGQASSTAVATATVLALCDAAGWKIDPLELALYVHRAECLFPVACAHAVDAMTCLHALEGPPGHLLRYSAQPHQLVGQVKLPKDVRILALDTGVRYTAAAATVEALRLAGAMGQRITETIYRDLGQRHTPLHGYLNNLSPALYRQYFRALMPRRMRGSDFIRTYGTLPEKAGIIDPAKVYRVRAAVDHLISEHEHAENFLQAIEELTDPALRRTLPPAHRERVLRRAGRLVLASHHSYRLRLELSCREADWVVDHLMESGPEKGIYGARISATGGGGTVVAVLNRSSQATDTLLKTLSAYHQITGLSLGVQEAGAAGAAGALYGAPVTLSL